MIGGTLGDLSIGGLSATGEVVGVTAKQTSYLNLHAEWDYQGETDPLDIVFLIYLDGELIRRLRGSARSADLLMPSAAAHQINIVSWPAHADPLDEDYGAVATTRAHLEWTRPADPSIGSYNLYHSTDGSTFEFYATHSQRSVQNAIHVLTSGAVASINGTAGGTTDTNTLYTLTVYDAASSSAIVSSDAGYSAVLHYLVGTPFDVLPGVQCSFTTAPANDDTLSILVGVQPEFNTDALPNGLHYFEVQAVDIEGNPGARSAAIPVTITAAPDPLDAFALGYDEATDEITFSATQNDSANAIAIYSNYDSGTGTLLPSVIFDAPLYYAALASGDSLTGEVLLAATGLPEGLFQFVPRAIDGTTGLDDQTSVVYSLQLPYVPPSLPVPFSLSATPTANGGVSLTWFAKKNAPGGWEIDVVTGPTAGVLPRVDSIPARATRNLSVFQFTATVTGADLGPEGIYVLQVRASNAAHNRFGEAATAQVVTDATPPAAITGLRGVPF